MLGKLTCFLRPFLNLRSVLVLAVLVVGSRAVVAAQDVKVFVSSQAGDRLSSKPDLHFASEAGAKAPVFVIQEDVKYQKIDGFGASLLESGLICINSLPQDKQEEVLRALFDPQRGAGFSAMAGCRRQPG